MAPILPTTGHFSTPNDASKIVLILGTQGFIIPGEHFGMSIFDPHLRYRWMIANSGNARPDEYIDVTYAPGVGRGTEQTATIALPNGAHFTAPTTVATQTSKPNPPFITADAATGVEFFAGVMDDPFFLDDTGANLLGASAMMHPGHPDKSLLGRRGGRDTYAGFNTLIRALELPVSMLKGSAPKIGIETATQRQAVQTEGANGVITGSGEWKTLDREGFPFINNALIPPPLKDAFGTSNPEATRTAFSRGDRDVASSTRHRRRARADGIRRRRDARRLPLCRSDRPQYGTRGWRQHFRRLAQEWRPAARRHRSNSRLHPPQ